MDYEIAFDQEESSYKVQTDYQFSAIAEWVSVYLKDVETVQKVLVAARLAEADKEVTEFNHGPFKVIFSEEGTLVSRQVDMQSAEEEIKAMFDSQDSFYRASTDGIQAECGLEDLIKMVESWYEVLQ
ncbi:YacL family protein [Marinomonas sp. C2222]|uniref:YacL family protein n=1 Tax=Marinomonas sargassi TaxID=2984494 RepID=A0ABT2YQQ3_9GAMM|nr:YacL family protein [Marinomonas sargassi]MCV2402220.1 YacL family protein [Marinomonas sargassi]